MKHEPPRAPSAAKFSAKTKNTEREAANLEVIEGFFTALVKNKDPKAVAGYLADDFVSHSPQVAGKQGMVDFAASQAEKQPGAGFVEVFHTVAKGDLVVKHYTYSNKPANGAELAIADFFRVKDGKIVEYWDVVAPIDKQ
ncbi:MAG: nuclear transport factor 2 family protein [Pseudonocardiaceae bacterium]